MNDRNSGGGNVVTENTVSNEVCGFAGWTITADTLAPNTYLTTSTFNCI